MQRRTAEQERTEDLTTCWHTTKSHTLLITLARFGAFVTYTARLAVSWRGFSPKTQRFQVSMSEGLRSLAGAGSYALAWRPRITRRCSRLGRHHGFPTDLVQPAAPADELGFPEIRFGRIDRSIGELLCVLRCRRTDARER